MKRINLILGLLVASFAAPAQNMVHNPGFENYNLCPGGISELDLIHSLEWDRPAPGSSDYFNACNAAPNSVSTPQNFAGYQVPYGGVAYAGIYAYANCFGCNYREYLRGVIDPLVPGTEYQVTIHISTANSSKFGASGLGVFFYKDDFLPPIPPNLNLLTEIPQVNYYSYGPISDTLNWVTLTGAFTADSAYTHLIIGNFRDDNNTVLDTIIPNSPLFNPSYYYVDDVEVVIAQFNGTPSHSNVTCNGMNNGTASVFAFGGTPPYNYLWTPGNQTTAAVTGLVAGSYTCRIIDAAPDTVYDTITITQPPVLTAVTSQNNVSCYGNNDGNAAVIPAGGTPGYTYSWAPTGGTNAIAAGLTSGSYTCTITDANGCTLQKTFTITQPNQLTANTSQTNILCHAAATGSATVSVSGGTAPYSYSWAPTGGNNATANNLSSGNYTCSITDVNGCTLQTTFALTDPPAITATTTQTNITCNGYANGIATVNPSGGVTPYSYSWAPSGGTAATANNLAPATYTCTITDANNCVLTKTFTITEPALLTASITHTNVTCYGNNNGTATATPSGGTAPYTYSWAPTGGNNATATGLTGGTYTCTVTDAHGCIATQSVTITQPTQQLSLVTSQANLQCNGGNTGIASVIVSGGVTPYSYSWAPYGGNNANAYTLAAGNYTCTITDANGCTITQAFTLTEPAPIVSTNSHADILCHGNTNGIATVLVSGGIAPYTYSWAPTGGNAPNATGLSAGTYTCTITDHNNCIHTEIVTISEPAALTVVDSQANITCFGDADGYAQVSVSGGTTPYTYAWAPAGGNGNAASALTAGTYSCTISDYNNCNHTEVFNITQPPALSAHTSKTNVVCQNLNQGMAIAVAQGGTPPYTYLWTPGNTTDTIISGLGIGMDTCTITDANGCTYAAIFNIVDTSQPFSYSITDSALGCRTALLDAIQGAGSSTATSYLWLFADSSSGTDNPAIHTFPQSGPNSTALVLVNAVGCHDTLSYNFSINYPMLADFSFDPNPPLANTQVHFYNASSPYATLFNWDFGDGTSSAQENPDKSYNDSGSYTICLIASDTNNCVDTACKDISIDVTKSIGVPSAFSPNGDGVNDVLYVRGYRIKAFRLRIYNRWGNLVFETDNKAKGWDGTYKGTPQVEEVYAYTLEATFTDGSTIQKAGSISLLR